MNKKEWQEHCKWLDQFRGTIVYDSGEKNKKKKKDIKKTKSKKNS